MSATADPGSGAAAPVSILLPCFNAARTVGRAIDSVAAQTHGDWQLICVDDASRDGTADLLAACRADLGARVSILRLSRNGGPAQARNVALARATGTWVAVLDADDAWHPERLQRLVGRADALGADIVCDNLMGFDDHGATPIGPLFESLPALLDIPLTVAAEYGGRYNLGYLKPLIRRDFIRAHGLRYDEALRTGEDLLFLLACLATGGRCHSVDWPGYVYTTPVGHTSRRLSRSTSTSPRDLDLASALERFLEQFGPALRGADIAAVEARINYLGAIAPLANFHHARLSRDWVTALRLFVGDRRVRRQVWTRLRRAPRSSDPRGLPG